MLHSAQGAPGRASLWNSWKLCHYSCWMGHHSRTGYGRFAILASCFYSPWTHPWFFCDIFCTVPDQPNCFHTGVRKSCIACKLWQTLHSILEWINDGSKMFLTYAGCKCRMKHFKQISKIFLEHFEHTDYCENKIDMHVLVWILNKTQ